LPKQPPPRINAPVTEGPIVALPVAPLQFAG
jgi:hypothetical protein